MNKKFEILSEETNRILELNSKLNKKISLNESTPRNLTVTVKNETGETIVGATVYDPDNTAVNGATDTDGKVILKNFSGVKIKVTFVGYTEKIIDIENIGVTDLLISCDKDQNLDELFSLIKEVSHC